MSVNKRSDINATTRSELVSVEINRSVMFGTLGGVGEFIPHYTKEQVSCAVKYSWIYILFFFSSQQNTRIPYRGIGYARGRTLNVTTILGIP